jgi:hypothetical protein
VVRLGRVVLAVRVGRHLRAVLEVLVGRVVRLGMVCMEAEKFRFILQVNKKSFF